MLKLAGALLIIAGSAAFGFLKCSDARNRIIQLNAIKKIFLMLRGEINYTGTALPDALESISRRVTIPYGEGMLIAISKELSQMGKKSFREVWHENVDKYLKYTMLTANDIEALKTIGDNLGYLDKDMHLNTIDLYLEQLNMDIAKASSEITEKCKVYKSVSIAVGIFITIIII